MRRQFEIIGEAMTRLRDQHPDVFDQIEEGPVVIAFRNRARSYAGVDEERWRGNGKQGPSLRSRTATGAMHKSETLQCSANRN